MIAIENHPGFGITAEYCLANARDCEVRRVESFERSDTDGFLSQWAGGLTASKWRLKAGIIQNGGYAEFTVLVDSGGTVVSDRTFTNQYGTSWIVMDEHQGRVGRKFIPHDGSHIETNERGYTFYEDGEEGYKPSRSRVQKRLGLRQERRQAQAWVCVTGSGKGLSGAASCGVECFPLRDDEKRMKLRRVL
jgi:hypothetical protein